MTVSYSGDPSESDVARCRFLIGDTDVEHPIMQDEEIQFIIDTYGSDDNLLNYNLYLRAATLVARDIKRTLGPQSEDPTGRLNFLQQQAAYFQSLLASKGVSIPRSLYPKIFYKGMHSNPPYPTPGGGRYLS